MLVPPLLQHLMHVLDHHDSSVNHRADSNGDAAQGHDVGVDPLVVHDDKCPEDAQRQRDDGHQRRAEMEQEQGADQRDDNKLLYQLMAEGLYGMLYQPRAIVNRNNLHAFRQVALEIAQLIFHRMQGLQRVFTVAHDDNAPGHLALAVILRHAPTDLRPIADAGNVAQQHGHAATAVDDDLAKISKAFKIAGGAHHILGLPHLQQRAAALLVRPLHRINYLLVGNIQRPHPYRIGDDLILAYHAADAGDLRHVGDSFQLKLKRPVLQRPQIGKAMLTAAIDKGIFVDPADAGGIRPQPDVNTGRQLSLDLA